LRVEKQRRTPLTWDELDINVQLDLIVGMRCIPPHERPRWPTFAAFIEDYATLRETIPAHHQDTDTWWCETQYQRWLADPTYAGPAIAEDDDDDAA
jgi:hypothetical protein